VQLVGKPENKDAAVPAELLDTSPPSGWDGQIVPWRKRGDERAPVQVREGPDAGDK